MSFWVQTLLSYGINVSFDARNLIWDECEWIPRNMLLCGKNEGHMMRDEIFGLIESVLHIHK